MVARDQRAPGRRIPQREGENAVEPAQPGLRRLAIAVQGVDHLAVGAGLETVGPGQAALELAMVVDLAIDREHQPPVRGMDRLRAAGRIDDCEAFMHQQRMRLHVHAAPIGSAVALARRQRKRQRAQRMQVGAGAQVEDTEDRAHRGGPCRGIGRVGNEEARTSQCGLREDQGVCCAR